MKIDFEVEIENQHGGTDFYLQTAETPEHALELFCALFNESCTIRRIWNPQREHRESVPLMCVRFGKDRGKVSIDDAGISYCSCGEELVCNQFGDMPNICPACRAWLDYSKI